MLELVERAGLQDLVAEHVQVDKPGGVTAVQKVLTLVAGVIAGADSIDDKGLLRHSAMRRLVPGSEHHRRSGRSVAHSPSAMFAISTP